MIRGTGHITAMGQKRNVYKVLTGNSKGNRKKIDDKPTYA
jgi:hypothetical protein